MKNRTLRKLMAGVCVTLAATLPVANVGCCVAFAEEQGMEQTDEEIAAYSEAPAEETVETAEETVETAVQTEQSEPETTVTIFEEATFLDTESPQDIEMADITDVFLSNEEAGGEEAPTDDAEGTSKDDMDDDSEGDPEEDPEDEPEETNRTFSMPEVKLDKEEIKNGTDVVVSFEEAMSEGGTIEFITEIPDGMLFKKIEKKPGFITDGDTVTITTEYKTDEDDEEWLSLNDTVKAKDVKFLKMTVESANAMFQDEEEPYELMLTALSTGTVVINTETVMTFSEDEEESEMNELELKVVGNTESDTTMSFEQDIAVPFRGSEVTNRVTINYSETEEARLIYYPDPAVNMKALNVSGSVFEGAEAVITDSAGSIKGVIGNSADLSNFTGITSIELKGAKKATGGRSESITFSFIVSDTAKEFRNAAALYVTPDEKEISIQDSFGSKVAYADVAPAAVTAEKTQIPYDSEFSVKLQPMKSTAYNISTMQTYECALSVPEWVTVTQVKLPEVEAAENKIILYVNGTESGTFASGAVVDVKAASIRTVSIKFQAEDSFEADTPLEIVMKNDIQKNTNTYFIFEGAERCSINNSVLGGSNSVLGIAFANYKAPEEKPSNNGGNNSGNNNNNNNNSGGGNGGSGGGSGTPSAPTDVITEDDEEDTKDDEVKKAQQKQEEKQKQDALLSARIKAINGNASGESGAAGAPGAAGSTSDSVAAEEVKEATVADEMAKYATDDIWKICPISETLLDVPETVKEDGIKPILEMISAVVKANTETAESETETEA